jgi:DNA-binding NtrC family response regulator
VDSIVLVTLSVPVRDAVERVLMRRHFAVRHEMSAESGADAARETPSVVLCTPETDWRKLLYALKVGAEVAPPLVLLLPEGDPRGWAEALLQGAFDAVSIKDSPDRLIETVEKAHARWHRARLVRDALRQNAAGTISRSA